MYWFMMYSLKIYLNRASKVLKTWFSCMKKASSKGIYLKHHLRAKRSEQPRVKLMLQKGLALPYCRWKLKLERDEFHGPAWVKAQASKIVNKVGHK